MRSLSLRALAWILVLICAIVLTARVTLNGKRQEMDGQALTLLLDIGLDEQLVRLDAAHPSDRQAILEAMPSRLRETASLRPLSDLPETLRSPWVMEGRPIWFDHGEFWAQVGEEQLLHLGPFFTPPIDRANVAVGLVIVGVLSLLASLAIAAPLAQRIAHLTRASARVAGGRLSTRVNDTSGDALGDLARQFDAMTEALERQRDEQEAFFHALTHELATPQARLAFALELLEQAPEDNRPARAVAMRRELDELESLTGELLEWVRQAPAARSTQSLINITETLEDLVDRTPASGIEVRVELAAGASRMLMAEERGFQRALDNILRNAVRYARRQVRLRVVMGDEALEVWVEDDGPGIAESDRARVFEPFTRVDASRDRASGGLGLGLSIVQRIVARHGGSAAAYHSPELGGAALVTRWPNKSA